MNIQEDEAMTIKPEFRIALKELSSNKTRGVYGILEEILKFKVKVIE